MAGRAHAEETRLQALELYSDLGLNEAARRMAGIASKSTISKWAKSAGIRGPRREAKLTPALARSKTFHKANRLKLNDRLFARIESILNKNKDLPPNRLKDLAITYAILSDKRRAEEGVTVADLDPKEIDRIQREAEEAAKRIAPGRNRLSLVQGIERERNVRAETTY